MKIIDKIKRWPIEWKRALTISLAIFFTILVIILNSALNILWADKNPKIVQTDNSSSSIQATFSELFSKISSTTAQTTQLIKETLSTQSSSSTTSDIVK